MKQLSITQKYYLCAVNQKGNLPFLRSTEISACILVSGILELLQVGYFNCGAKDKLTLQRLWDGEPAYLRSLYDVIVSGKKPKSTKEIAQYYLISLTDQPLKALVSEIGASLAAGGYTTELTGKTKNKDTGRYAPRLEKAKEIITEIKSELANEVALSEEFLCLATLLDKSNLLKLYCTAEEIKLYKKHIKEVRNSETYREIKKVLDYIDSVVAVFVVLMTAFAGASSNG